MYAGRSGIRSSPHSWPRPVTQPLSPALPDLLDVRLRGLAERAWRCPRARPRRAAAAGRRPGGRDGPAGRRAHRGCAACGPPPAGPGRRRRRGSPTRCSPRGSGVGSSPGRPWQSTPGWREPSPIERMPRPPRWPRTAVPRTMTSRSCRGGSGRGGGPAVDRAAEEADHWLRALDIWPTGPVGDTPRHPCGWRPRSHEVNGSRSRRCRWRPRRGAERRRRALADSMPGSELELRSARPTTAASGRGPRWARALVEGARRCTRTRRCASERSAPSTGARPADLASGGTRGLAGASEASAAARRSSGTRLLLRRHASSVAGTHGYGRPGRGTRS